MQIKKKQTTKDIKQILSQQSHNINRSVTVNAYKINTVHFIAVTNFLKKKKIYVLVHDVSNWNVSSRRIIYTRNGKGEQERNAIIKNKDTYDIQKGLATL